MTRVTEKSEIIIDDMSEIDAAIKPHIDKLVHAIKFFNSRYIRITSNIEQIKDGSVHVHISALDMPKKKK